MFAPLPPSTPCRVYEHYEEQDTKDNGLVMDVHISNQATSRLLFATFPTFPIFPTFHRGKRTKDGDSMSEYVEMWWWKSVVVCHVLFVPL